MDNLHCKHMLQLDVHSVSLC